MGALREVGPFLLAAERFLSRESVVGEPARGVEGLRWLSRRIDAFAAREHASAQEESAFVEGAGAFFALLLLEHFGEGAHVMRDGAHRVRLGRSGFFDPFAAIEGALDAEGARAALVSAVARAEHEARGTGGTGAAMLVFERFLGEQRPDLAIVDRFDRRVWLEGAAEIGRFEVDLGGAIDASDDQAPRALEQATSKIVSMLPGGPGQVLDRDEAVSRLLPRIVSPSEWGLTANGLFLWPMVNDVAVALMVAYDDRARYLRDREIEAWNLTRGDAVRMAVANLAARSDKTRFARVETEAGPLVVSRTGDGLDSARLLLPSMHDVLAPELGSSFLAAIPHRDALLACPKEPAAIRAALSARAEDDFRRAPHRITSALFEVSASGLKTWGQGPSG
jgi:hypothetical protein